MCKGQVLLLTVYKVLLQRQIEDNVNVIVLQLDPQPFQTGKVFLCPG